MSKLDKILASTSPEQRANDPVLRKAFIIGLMDRYALCQSGRPWFIPIAIGQSRDLKSRAKRIEIISRRYRGN